MKVGIIGGGATGLAAAYELGRCGHEAAVFERTDFLGGQASTFDVGGGKLERGYHHLFTGDHAILDLMEEIGLGDRVLRFDSKVGTLHDGKIYDFVTATDLLRFTPLSLIDRVRLGLVTMRLRMMKDWRPLERHTAAEWLRKHAGQGCYDTFWGPMLRGKFGEEYFEEVGMAWVWGKIHTRFASRQGGVGKEQLVYPAGSFGEVFDALADRIHQQGGSIDVRREVTRVAVEDGEARGLRVEAADDEAKGRRAEEAHEFDAIISTTQSHIFRRLVPDLPAGYHAKLEAAKYMAAVLLILELDRPLSHVYWLNVADRSIPFVGVIEQTNLVDPSHYGGRHVVYLSNYVDRGHRLYGLDHGELLAEYMPHLRKINAGFEESWILDSHHHRVDAAQPIIGADYLRRMPDLRTPIRGLYLCNTTQIYPEDRGTNYSVLMGRRVARMVMGDATLRQAQGERGL